MIVVDAISKLREAVSGWRQSGLRIGFVPTMGNLHAGHLSLVEAAKQHADRVVVSIFVNPLQFNQAADFSAYPKTLQQDIEQLKATAADLLFTPTEAIMYPEGQGAITRVQVPEITEMLEGEHRPGHFEGVATVVTKLFNQVQPDLAVFGEKDYQQLQMVRQLVRDLDMPIDILSMPTFREPDGLAMSSRNTRLPEEQRLQAAQLYKVLDEAREKLLQGDSIASVEAWARNTLENAGFQVEYISCRRADDLLIATENDPQRRLLAAAWLGDVRLIDNLPVD